MLADTLSARLIYSRILPMTLPARSGSPTPSGPWPRPAKGKAAPPRSVHPGEVRALENVWEPLARAPTAPRATAIVPPAGTDRLASEYCRNCRVPNKDLAPSAESPSKAQEPAHSRPLAHTTRRLPPPPPQTWRNPDSPGRATRDLPRIDQRGCTPLPASAAHNHTPDGPLPPTPPTQSRDHARPPCYTPSPSPPSWTDFPDTVTARVAAPSDHLPSTPAG